MKETINPAILILVLVLAGVSSLYLAVITQSSFGFYHDDGIYVVTAKALATNHSYHIISLPNELAQTKYPPIYPFLLSLIWRINPQFPENLSAMMTLSILATIGSLAFTWWYLTRQRYALSGQAWLVVCLAAINWRTLILATGIYSEMFYTLLSLAGLYLAETYEKEQQTWKRAVGLGAVIGLAFLTRTSGIALLIAVAAYYAIHRKTRRAFLPIAVGSLFIIAWMGWSYMNRSSAEGVNAAYYTSYFRDFSEIIAELQSQSGASTLSIFLSLIFKNVLLVTISIPAVCAGLRYDSLQNLSTRSLGLGLIFSVMIVLLVIKGFLRDRLAGLRLLHIYVVTYLALHLLWPYGIYDRFLMPLLPFLLLFLITECEGLIQLTRRGYSSSGQIAGRFAALVVTSAMILLFGVILYSYGAGVYRALFFSKDNAVRRAEEDAEAIGWIKTNTDPSDVLVCYRDPLYYLYTGRKATRLSSKGLSKLDDRQASPDEGEIAIFRIVDENDARYLISTSSDFELEGPEAELHRQGLKLLLEENSLVFVPVFESKTRRAVVYQVDKGGR